MRPHRTSLYGFPDVVLHADESAVKRHLQFAPAKAGDISAAEALVADMANPDCVQALQALLHGRQAELVSVHALETEGVNEIPAALAKLLSLWLGLPSNDSVVQSNTVGHTGASGYHRLANQAQFFGLVRPEQHYLIVDDFVGQGGTLANLIGFIKSQAGHVIGATALTGKPYSAKLAPNEMQIQALRDKYGQEFEEWWRQRFGFGFAELTRSEARYLENSPDAHTIRDRLVAAGLEGSSPSSSAQHAPIAPRTEPD
jgi:hypothetical protein